MANDEGQGRNGLQTPSKGRLWLEGLKVYFEPPLLVVFALGFTSGLPLFLIGSTLNIWMREEGISLTTIGFFSLVGMPYILKFLWAPLIDHLRLPFLEPRLGRRRSWLVFTQGLLILTILAMGTIDPVATPALMAAAALAVAMASATQDIVIDAFRTEYLEEHRYAAGMANYVAAYRIAMLVSSAGALFLVTWFQDAAGLATQASWRFAYAIMAALVLVGTLATLLAKEPRDLSTPVAANETYGQLFVRAVIHPFTDFFKRSHALAILAFVLLFKMGDALAGTMTAAFVIDIGFTRDIYGGIVGGYGLFATLVGGFLGGYVQRVRPLLQTLWIAGILQMLSNLAYVWLAAVGADLSVLTTAVTIENMTGGFGTVIFVAYISGLCVNRDFTATQFALLTALAAFGRVVISAFGGLIVDHSNWVVFFWITTFAALPGLGFLAFMQRKNLLDASSER